MDGTFIIAIDGRCCAGKTTLARCLARKLKANVFHIDDFFLPPERRERKIAGHIDIERFKKEVLLPIARGQEATCRAYDCKSGKTKRAAKKPAKNAAIIEGCYSTHPKLVNYYDYKVFLTLSPKAQQRRIILREGFKGFKKFASLWLPEEEKYFRKYRACALADSALDTSDLW
jgi:uridine kinase